MICFNTPNKVLSFLIVTFTSTFAVPVLAQKDVLRQKIIAFAATCKGDVGVSVLGLEDRDTLSYHGKKHYAMQSVYKLHLAMAVLTQVDKGKLSLSQKIHVTKKDLLPDTWSPLRDEYPEGDAHIALYDILRYTVSQSDNNGCDILFRLLGGPEKVNAYIHNLGITQTAIVATEEDMHKKWDTQFANWSETDAIVQLLDIIFQRKLLSTTSSIVLWKFMTQTATGANRIRGMLPEGTTVAHKTGSSGTDEHGNTPATNDAGIIKLPNGKHIAIVVFVANAKADEATRDAAIAKISKATWDYFAAK